MRVTNVSPPSMDTRNPKEVTYWLFSMDTTSEFNKIFVLFIIMFKYTSSETLLKSLSLTPESFSDSTITTMSSMYRSNNVDKRKREKKSFNRQQTKATTDSKSRVQVDGARLIFIAAHSHDALTMKQKAVTCAPAGQFP
ncbi:hypothetical protein EVAR_19090_1 [Eumeta japonica]|uniref:Uncharacterized protein n=1 Tax=Eumeta variegata TaxID=151549 RepID=A0A4C1UP42_EUMVA|nr:hypothetical protein EVAR_19090_1 [Eumeta japonica]